MKQFNNISLNTAFFYSVVILVLAYGTNGAEQHNTDYYRHPNQPNSAQDHGTEDLRRQQDHPDYRSHDVRGHFDNHARQPEHQEPDNRNHDDRRQDPRYPEYTNPNEIRPDDRHPEYNHPLDKEAGHRRPDDVDPYNRGHDNRHPDPDQRRPEDVDPYNRGHDDRHPEPGHRRPDDVDPYNRVHDDRHPEQDQRRPEDVDPYNRGQDGRHPEPEHLDPYNRGHDDRHPQPDHRRPEHLDPYNRGHDDRNPEPGHRRPEDVDPYNRGHDERHPEPEHRRPEDVDPYNRGRDDRHPEPEHRRPEDVDPYNRGYDERHPEPEHRRPEDVDPYNRGHDDRHPEQDQRRPEYLDPYNRGHDDRHPEPDQRRPEHLDPYIRGHDDRHPEPDQRRPEDVDPYNRGHDDRYPEPGHRRPDDVDPYNRVHDDRHPENHTADIRHEEEDQRRNTEPHDPRYPDYQNYGHYRPEESQPERYSPERPEDRQPDYRQPEQGHHDYQGHHDPRQDQERDNRTHERPEDRQPEHGYDNRAPDYRYPQTDDNRHEQGREYLPHDRVRPDPRDRHDSRYPDERYTQERPEERPEHRPPPYGYPGVESHHPTHPTSDHRVQEDPRQHHEAEGHRQPEPPRYDHSRPVDRQPEPRQPEYDNRDPYYDYMTTTEDPRVHMYYPSYEDGRTTVPEIVDIPQLGRVLGTVSFSAWTRQPIHTFANIRYAESPRNENRFKPPIPVRPWSGIFNGTSEKVACPSFKALSEIKLKETTSDVEDCLRLSIHTPNTKGRYPVMVYFHGEFFFDGSLEEAKPDYLLEKDIVLVAVQYRLAPIGFLSTGTEDMPGNIAVHDAMQSLKWIQQNIGPFGGDPYEVTLFGQGAGSALVHVLTMSPLVPSNLFRNVILQSGSALSHFFLTDSPLEYAEDIARRGRCPSLDTEEDIAQCLTNMPISTLLQAFVCHGNANEKLGVGKFGGFQFVYDDVNKVLPEHPIDLLRKTETEHHPMMGGTTADVGTFMFKKIIEQFHNSLVNNFNIKTAFDSVGRYLLGNDTGGLYYNLFKVSFLNDDGTDYNLTTITPNLIDLVSVILYKAPMLEALQMNARHLPNNTFLYAFKHNSNLHRYNLNSPYVQYTSGPSLSDDNIYLFPYPPHVAHLEGKDREMAEIMVDLWTTFAKTGVPKSSSNSCFPLTEYVGPYFMIDTDRLHYEDYRDEFFSAINSQIEDEE